MTAPPEEDRPQRLFVAVPLTDASRESMTAVIPRVLPGRPVPPDNWHFTLRFLGSTDRRIARALVADLLGLRLGPVFEIEFDTLGAFPNARRARILWAGVALGADRMRSLASTVEAAATRAGFEAEKRDFTPHLTLSRIDLPASVADIIAQTKLRVKMRVERIVLYRSRLGRGPASYEELESFPLSN